MAGCCGWWSLIWRRISSPSNYEETFDFMQHWCTHVTSCGTHVRTTIGQLMPRAILLLKIWNIVLYFTHSADILGLWFINIVMKVAIHITMLCSTQSYEHACLALYESSNSSKTITHCIPAHIYLAETNKIAGTKLDCNYRKCECEKISPEIVYISFRIILRNQVMRRKGLPLDMNSSLHSI